jgi:hypothetical protein
MDQISKIYAHSEFVNNLFHDELVRIKDLCISELSSPATASSSASSPAAARPPIELLRGPLKRPERAISKVTATMIVTLCSIHSSDAMQVYRCYKGNFSHLSDTVRCVVVCDSIQNIQAFMITLARHSFTLADKPLSFLDRFLRLFEVFCVLRWPPYTRCDSFEGSASRSRRSAEALCKLVDGMSLRKRRDEVSCFES